MEKNLSIIEFEKFLEKYNTMFLFGNGMSMNFDSDFGNIYERLFEAHKYLIRNTEYRTNGNNNFNKKCTENYKSIRMTLQKFTKEIFYKIFEDGLKFGEIILRDNKLIKTLWEKGLLSNLTFGLTEIDVLKQMNKVWKNKGIKYINIEHWTILVYFYFAINRVDLNYNQKIKPNLFIDIIEKGDINKIKLTDLLMEETILNGFTIYYKFLFLTAIFSKGKAIDIKKLNRINTLSFEKIEDFLSKYESIISLNYDNIIESLLKRPIIYLHGKFSEEIDEYVFYQNYSLKYKDKKISLSDILIGDYFSLKNLITVVNSFSDTDKNKKIKSVEKIFKEEMKSKNISTVVIFGICIENDQHILINLLYELFNTQRKKTEIIYCYFTENDKKEFMNQYVKIKNTVDLDLMRYVDEGIELLFIDTKLILNKYFRKD